MITTREELNAYLRADMQFYRYYTVREKIINCFTRDPAFCIRQYLYHLRMEEFYYNRGKKTDTILYLWHFRRKNLIGNRLGIKIPRNTTGPGLTIYHHGLVIVNENARIGANCVFHGQNCVGNNGIDTDAPVIGDGLDLGIGAKVIGGVELGNNVRVGANAVVTKSFTENDITLVGAPAVKR